MVKANKSNVTKDCIFFPPVEIRYHLNMLVLGENCSISSRFVDEPGGHYTQ